MNLQLEFEWGKLKNRIKDQFGAAPEMEAILFLIGVREYGKIKSIYTKEEKIDLMHLATCRVLSQEGYFELEFTDQDGWPHYRATAKQRPTGLEEQEVLLKKNIINYFNAI